MAQAPGHSEQPRATTTVRAPPSCLHDSQLSPFITATAASFRSSPRDRHRVRENEWAREIATLALLFNSCRRRRTPQNYSEEQETHGGSATFNCTSLAESHPIRALYIFPNSGWWGRAYEAARPARRCYAAGWLLSSRGALGDKWAESFNLIGLESCRLQGHGSSGARLTLNMKKSEVNCLHLLPVAGAGCDWLPKVGTISHGRGKRAWV